MANTAKTDLKTITQRNKLAVQPTPHCETVADQRVLGFVSKGRDVSGVWIVRQELKRTASGAPVRVRAKLGVSCILKDEADANEAAGILSYEQARDAAKAHVFVDPSAPVVRSGFTVGEAVELHRDYGGKRGKKKERAKIAAYNNLRWNVLRLESDGTKRDGNLGLGDVAVNDLTAERLIALRASWIAETCEATALRNWTNLHSCLEQAATVKANGITNGVWRAPKRGGAVPLMDQEFAGRKLYFTNEQALAIIAHARGIDADVADYFEALYRIGARPGEELFTRTVGDFTPATRKLSITGKTGHRSIGVDVFAFALLQRLSAGRPSTAPLFTPCDERGRIKAVMVAAVCAVLGEETFLVTDEKTGEKSYPDVVPYAFRHTFISTRLSAGMGTHRVARYCGTSEYMINKNYFHAIPDEDQAALEATAPQPMLQVVRTAA